MFGLLGAVLPDSIEELLRRAVAAVDGERTTGGRGGPEPVPLLREERLRDALDGAALLSPDATEAVARGALVAGRRARDVLAWAGAESANRAPRAAAVTAVLRDAGYEPALRWAEAASDGAVHTIPAPPGLDPDLFAVPRRVAALGEGIRRLFAADYPETIPAVRALVGLGDSDLLRPEVVPALAREEGLLAALTEADDERFERVILPLSRLPGVNVLVLAGLLINELLDPMEVLDWIGQDVANLPRRGVPNRPETIHPLPGPASGDEPTKYMIFSDIHREPDVDREFRIDHFHGNRDMYLRILDWCDDAGYTVIENGDCEELWFEPTFDPVRRLSKRDRLERIVTGHQAVYDKLADMADRGRYVRSIGNHDSYLWEDPDVRAWLAANPFPELHGGFVIPQVKTMDDRWPHVGLDPDAYADRQAMLVVHGHQYDFWNCDEHNRVGKFIANAVGVPADAFGDLVYDWCGIDISGHPLVEFWDVLAPITPFDNWPPAEMARTWAEAVEQRSPYVNVTLDSIMFSETFVAVMAMLMRDGEFAPGNFGVLLCAGHTHNPQSRPWIPYLDRFNPWRETEIFGIRAFERLFAIKTRYLNSGTVGWWEDLVWAIEVTAAGQPRLVYWSREDREPVTMDWELHDQPAVPASPFGDLATWAGNYLRDDPAAALSELAASTSEAQPATEHEAMQRIRDLVADGVSPDLGTVADLLAPVAPGGSATDFFGSALARLGPLDDPYRLATVLLAAAREPGLRGVDPRSLPRRLARERAPEPLPGISPLLWPRLLTGADGDADGGEIDVAAMVRSLYRAFRLKLPATPEATR